MFRGEECTEMCSGSVAGSHLKLIYFVYHSTLGLRVLKKKKMKNAGEGSVTDDDDRDGEARVQPIPVFRTSIEGRRMRDTGLPRS